MIGTCSVLMAGYATDDQELINAALYGVHTALTEPNQVGFRQFPPPQDWIAGTPETQTHGLLNTFFAPPAIPGGMWIEGTASYAFYVLGAYIDSAEVAWHHGLDLYRHNNAIFKNLFDFPILNSYPDLSTPILNDSQRLTIMGPPASLYEYAYRRYRDPNYLPLINTPNEREFQGLLDTTTNPDAKVLEPFVKGWKAIRYVTVTHIGSNPPSILFDLDPKAGLSLPAVPSVNYP